MSHTLIVGNGPAAHRLAARMTALGPGGEGRTGGTDGMEHTVTVLGAEARPAYNRVLLPSVLDGSLPPGALRLPALPAPVRVHLGVDVTAIDRDRRVVHTGTGDSHGYDTLVLATGATPRMPDVPGLASAERVATLRTLRDGERIGRMADASGSVAVLGGGVLGVEAARALVGRGAAVTLVHPQPHVMDLDSWGDGTGGRLLADRLRSHGVDLSLGRRAVECRGTGVADGTAELVLDDGGTVAAGVILVCAGAAPETGLALAAGLTVRHGVVVDDELRTDDPHIHALGDCAEHDGAVAGLIAPAWDQAEALARTLTGTPTPYRAPGHVTRLKARGIDLVTLGDTGGAGSPGAPDADVEVITLSDPARGRYARLALRDRRVDGAVLLGFEHAIAALTQLHDRGRPVPSDRLGLLLGGAAPTGRPPAGLPGDAVVCRCSNVTKDALVTAWHAGARSLRALARATRATTGCGTCTEDVRRVCGALTPEPHPPGPHLTAQPLPEQPLPEQEGAA